MKRQILIALFTLFAFLYSTTLANAQTPTANPTLSIQEATQSATPSGFVQYDLAYPGLLPDHPLYNLKVLRDKISLAFISDPKKKIDFYLLQADKGILATAMLIDKNNTQLAEETALKAEHNYTLLTQQQYNLPVKPEDDFFVKLKTAALKHQEVLQSLIKRVPEDKQKTFTQVLEFSKRNQQAVEDYKNKRDTTGQINSPTISPN